MKGKITDTGRTRKKIIMTKQEINYLTDFFEHKKA